MIPAAAIEAARSAYLAYPMTRGIDSSLAAFRAALEAAAPYIVAETAERIAAEMQSWAGPAERGYTQSFAETARQQLPTTE